jgi:hypothetical protein
MIDQPTAEDALKALEPLVGEWTLNAISPTDEPWPGEARATFAWHASGAHLVQTAAIKLPGAPDSISIIGCDAANRTGGSPAAGRSGGRRQLHHRLRPHVRPGGVAGAQSGVLGSMGPQLPTCGRVVGPQLPTHGRVAASARCAGACPSPM